MQTVTSREVQNHYGEFLESVQDDVVCVTRHGRPLFWALSDRDVRTQDPSAFIGRMLLLRGQLRRESGLPQESIEKTFERLDPAIQAEGLSEDDVSAVVRSQRA